MSGADVRSGSAAPNYGIYQIEVYKRGLLEGILPRVTTDPNRLEQQAQEHLGVTSYNYVAGAAGERATLDANRLAFRQWKLIPRMLRSTTNHDMSTTLFGHKHPSPLLFAPVGVQAIFHADKETGVAAAAAEIRVPYIHSTAATSSIEEVAAANGPGGARWFQLYWPHDDEITASLLARAKANGFSVLVVTLDTWALGYRPADLDQAYVPFALGIGNANGFTDPVVRRQFREAYGGKEMEDLDVKIASAFWERKVFTGQNHTWEQLKVVREHWDGPIVLKGIQHVEDARLAVQAGVQGIVVSNHGGRQLDGAIASLDVLPEIVEAVGEEVTVLFDSGVRTGVDVIKAICLGAKGVLIGRPFVYGLAVAGRAGARDVMKGILADLDRSMGLAGIATLEDCKPSLVRKVPYGGHHSSN